MHNVLILIVLILIDHAMPRTRRVPRRAGGQGSVGLQLSIWGWLAGSVMGGLGLSDFPLLIGLGTCLALSRDLPGWWRWVMFVFAGLFGAMCAAVVSGERPPIEWDALLLTPFGGAAVVMMIVGGFGRETRGMALAGLAQWRDRRMPDWLRKTLIVGLADWLDHNDRVISKWQAWRRVTMTGGVMSVRGGVSLDRLNMSELPVRIGGVSGTLDLSHNRLINLDGVDGPVMELDASCNPIERVDGAVAGTWLVLNGCPKLMIIENDNSKIILEESRATIEARRIELERQNLRGVAAVGATGGPRLM